MKPITLHPGSVVAGVALAAVAVFAIGAQVPVADDSFFHRAAPSQPVIVAGIYDPRNGVRLEGTFTVPEHKVLVVTAIASFQGGQAYLYIPDFWGSGLPEQISVNTLPSDPIIEIPAPGLVVSAGTQISTVIAYGYVVDAPDSDGKSRRTGPQDQAVRVVGIPGDARDFVYVRSDPADPNHSYQVPQGKRLVVTGFGSSAPATWVELREYRSELEYFEPQPGQLFYVLPSPGVPIASGRVVNPVSDVAYFGRAFGYLVDE